MDRTWETTKHQCRNLGMSREVLLPPFDPKQQGKGEVIRTLKERDLEVKQFNLCDQ